MCSWHQFRPNSPFGRAGTRHRRRRPGSARSSRKEKYASSDHRASAQGQPQVSSEPKLRTSSSQPLPSRSTGRRPAADKVQAGANSFSRRPIECITTTDQISLNHRYDFIDPPLKERRDSDCLLSAGCARLAMPTRPNCAGTSYPRKGGRLFVLTRRSPMSGAGTDDGGRISTLFPQGKIARIPATTTALVLAIDDSKLRSSDRRCRARVTEVPRAHEFLLPQ